MKTLEERFHIAHKCANCGQDVEYYHGVDVWLHTVTKSGMCSYRPFTRPVATPQVKCSIVVTKVVEKPKKDSRKKGGKGK